MSWVYKVSLMDLQWESFWRFIHWRGNRRIKGYLWRRFQFYIIRGKEEFWCHSFSRPGIYWGASNQAINRDLWEIRITVRNEWELFILWHSILMSWNSVGLSRKFTWRTKYGSKHLLIGPCIGWPISQHWWVVDEIGIGSEGANLSHFWRAKNLGQILRIPKHALVYLTNVLLSIYS